MDFINFFIPCISDVKESVCRSFTRPLYSGNLEIPGPVLQELEGTDDWVLWIFVISSFFTLSRSMNLFLAVSRSYHVRVTLKKSRSTAGFGGILGYCRLDLMDFSNIYNPYVLDVKESVLVVSHNHVRVTSKIQVNFRFCRNSRVLTVGSYGFS